MTITFLPPNFECQVCIKYSSAKKKKKEWVLCHAPDEDRARQLLDKLNYVTYKVRPYDFEIDWRREASEELKKAARLILPVIAAGRKPIYSGQSPDYQFNEDLWKKLTAHLVWLFHGNCAYCQSDMGNDVRYCQVEHYRPKGAVNGVANHPGYWWLAYEPTNYLPACKICNGYVKMNHFPLMVENQRVRILSVDPQNDAGLVALYQDLAQEQPVIINPYQEDPADYLNFIPVCTSPNLGVVAPGNTVDIPGIAIPKNDRATKVIELMKLNVNSMLLFHRRKVQQDVLHSLTQALSTMNAQALKSLIQDIKEGNQECYTAAKVEVQAYLKEMGLPDLFQ